VATLKTAGARLGTNLQLQSQQQPDVNAPKTSQEDFDLFMSVFNNNTSKIQKMIDEGYDFSKTDSKGQTIIWHAAFLNRPEIIKLLVEHSIPLECFNKAAKDGKTPTDNARFLGNKHIVELIQIADLVDSIYLGQDVNSPDVDLSSKAESNRDVPLRDVFLNRLKANLLKHGIKSQFESHLYENAISEYLGSKLPDFLADDIVAMVRVLHTNRDKVLSKIGNSVLKEMGIETIDVVKLFGVRDELIALMLQSEPIAGELNALRNVILLESEHETVMSLFDRYDKLSDNVKQLIKENAPSIEEAQNVLLLKLEKSEYHQNDISKPVNNNPEINNKPEIISEHLIDRYRKFESSADKLSNPELLKIAKLADCVYLGDEIDLQGADLSAKSVDNRSFFLERLKANILKYGIQPQFESNIYRQALSESLDDKLPDFLSDDIIVMLQSLHAVRNKTLDKIEKFITNELKVKKIDVMTLFESREELIALMLQSETIAKELSVLREVILVEHEHIVVRALFDRYDNLTNNTKHLIKENAPSIEEATKNLLSKIISKAEGSLEYTVKNAPENKIVKNDNGKAKEQSAEKAEKAEKNEIKEVIEKPDNQSFTSITELFAVEIGALDTADEDVRKISVLIEGNERIGEHTNKAALLMGNTGAGKSTLAHALCGIELQAILDDETGNLLIDAMQPLDNIKIGNRMSSETTVPNRCKTSGVTIWDCPGFNDTEVIQEIANSFYIKRLLDNSGSLKFVLVVTEADLIGTKGNYFVNVLERFLKGFNNMEQIEDAISLVITQVASHKKLDHITKNLSNILEHNQQVTEQMQKLVPKIIENNSLHLFYKPKDEGSYLYNQNMFDEVDQCGSYVDSKPNMANLVVSDKAKEYSKKLLETVKDNFNKILSVAAGALADPEISVKTGEDNILINQYHLIKDWIPKSIAYDNTSLNMQNVKGYFTELKQIKSLKESLTSVDINSLDAGVSTVQSALKTLEKFVRGSEKINLRKVIQEYSKILEQQYNYVKFFSEVCRADLPNADKFQEAVDLCTGKLDEIWSYKIKTLNLDDTITEPNYYKEAIEYLDTQVGNYHCLQTKAEALCKLGEISEMSDTSAAIKYYTEAVQAHKEMPDIYEKLGALLTNNGNYNKAIFCYKVINDTYAIRECFKAWLQQDPTNPEIMMMRGDHLSSMGAVNSAVKCYNDAAFLFKGEQNQHKKDEALSKVAEILENNFNLADHFRHMVSEHDYFNFDMVNEEFVTNLMGDFSQSSQS
jgi:predicted GTPase